MPCWRGWRLWQAAGRQGWAQLCKGTGSLAPLPTAATLSTHPRKPSPLPSDVPPKPRVGGRGPGTEPALPFPCIPLPGFVLLGALKGKPWPTKGATIPHQFGAGVLGNPGAARSEKILRKTGERLPHVLLSAQVNFQLPFAAREGELKQRGADTLGSLRYL